MPEMDQGIKRLLQTHPGDVLALALPEAEYLGTLPVDVATEPQLVLDTLLRARYHGIECAVDLEAEARPREDMGRRCFEYGARATIVTGLPTISVVMWLEPDGAPPVSPYELWVDDRLVGTWHFIGIEVYRLRAEALIDSWLLGLLPLVAFTADATDVSVVERAAQLVKDQAPADQVSELESLLVVFAARTFGNDRALEIIRRLFVSTEILEQSPLYRLWREQAMQEGIEHGIEQGREQGIEQGREQGLQQGLAEGALAALRLRFGELAHEVEQAVASARKETLEDVLAHVATDTLEHVRARLGL